MNVITVPAPVRSNLCDWYIAIQQNTALPTFSTAEIQRLQLHLEQVLTDVGVRGGHLAFLETLGPPAKTLRGRQPEDGTYSVKAILDEGVSGLPLAVVVPLLLDPFGLDHLASTIAETIPEAWIDALAAAGEEIRNRNGWPLPPLKLPKPKTTKKKRKLVLMTGKDGNPAKQQLAPLKEEIAVPEANRGAWAAVLYGDATRAFQLFVWREAAAAGATEHVFAVGVLPAPTHQPLTVTVELGPERVLRAFSLEVDPTLSRDPDADPLPFKSAPCEPVPAFEFKGEQTWSPTDANRLLFRSGDARGTAFVINELSPQDPVDSLEPTMNEQATEIPAELRAAFELLQAIEAVRQGEMSGEQLFQFVTSRELAQMATPESCAFLAQILTEQATENEQFAGLLAELIFAHANTLDDLGGSVWAWPMCEACLPLFAQLEPAEFASKLNDIAIIAKHTHRYENALALYAKALAIYEPLLAQGGTELAPDLARTHMNMGNALASLQQLREAVTSYGKALAIYEPLLAQGGTELAPDLARTHGNMGIALQSLEQLREVVTSYGKALAILEPLVQQGRTELAPELALTHMNMGIALQSLEQLREAVTSYGKALGIYEPLVQQGRTELAPDLALAHVNMGNALRQLQQLREAVTSYGAALAIYEPLVQQGRTELAPDLARTHWNIGNVYKDDRSHQFATEGERSEVARLQRAVLSYDRVDVRHFTITEQITYHNTLSGVHWELRQHGDELEHATKAQEHAAQARTLFRQVRAVAGIDETTLEFLDRYQPLFASGMRRHLELQQPREAFSVLQEGKATLLRDALARKPKETRAEDPSVQTSRKAFGAALRDPDGDVAQTGGAYLQCWRRDLIERYGATPVNDRVVDLGLIQQQLPDDWAILDFFQDGEEVTSFALTKEQLHVEQCSFPVKNDGFVRNLFALLELQQNPSLCLQREAINDTALDQLHSLLFLKVKKWLHERGIKGLYLVPHGLLNLFPLHLARFKKDGKATYLCDEFAIAYLPAAGLLPELPTLDVQGKWLSAVNPDRGRKGTLPLSDWEGKLLQRRWGQNSTFVGGPDATFDVTEKWSDANVVHFSCHGLGDAEFAPWSRLYLRDDVLLAHDVTYRRPPLKNGSLVVLNGCQTSVKDMRAGAESLGLMTAFLQRGAGLVCSTMWSVFDGCAASMVLHFTEQLLDKKAPPAAALQYAQRELRNMPPQRLLDNLEDAHQSFALNEKEHRAELAKLLVQKAWVCSRMGRTTEAKHAADEAAPLLREFGFEGEAQRLKDANGKLVELGDGCFDHPIIWGAFQLVGRVTSPPS